MCRKSTCNQKTCDTTNCCQCLADIIASSARNPLQVSMLFWHEFANSEDLGIDSMNNYPLTMVNSPVQEVGTGVGGGFGLTGGGVGTMAHATKDWGKHIFDMGRSNWSISYWKNQNDPAGGSDLHINASSLTVTSGDSMGVGGGFSTLEHSGNQWAVASSVYPPDHDDGGGFYDTSRVRLRSLDDGNPPGAFAAKWGIVEISRNNGQTEPVYNVWTHWGFTFDTSNYTLSVYKNGSLIDSITNVWPDAYNFRASYAPYAPSDNHLSTHPPRYLTHSYKDTGVMRILRGDARYFDGAVAEPAMWSRVLTSTEIAGLATGLSFNDALTWIPS